MTEIFDTDILHLALEAVRFKSDFDILLMRQQIGMLLSSLIIALFLNNSHMDNTLNEL